MAAIYPRQVTFETLCTALNAENAQLRAIASTVSETGNRLWQVSPDLMLVAQFDGILVDVNPAWTRSLGWTEPELIGRNLFDFVHPDDVDRTLGGAKSLAAGVTLERFDNRYRHKNGSYRWIAWAAVPDEGFIHAVGRDCTGEKEQAVALHQSEAALRQSQKMEAIGQLSGGIAHDFNNMLASISGSLELLQARMAQGQSSDLGQYLATAQGATKRAAALTRRLLAFSRQQNPTPKPTDVNRLVAGIEELIRRSVGPQIMVQVVKAKDLWTTWIDANQLENALLNLCINARDSMPEGGRLTIETVNTWLSGRMAYEYDLPMGQYVTLAVSDTGSGMAPEIMARAFDPFFTTKPVGKGTGLGLSMIYGFARQSGGQAQIESKLGWGTTVALYLPRHMGQAEESVDAEQPADLAAAPHAGRGETVLVVDDELTIRDIIIDVLQGLSYAAIAAADGEAGLKVLQSQARVDLLITDIGLPGGMDGQQLADAARELRPGLKVLFITGYAEDAVSHGDGGMHVLIKPFAMEALARRIKKLVT
jgi:PAS domain S-box-containing protein